MTREEKIATAAEENRQAQWGNHEYKEGFIDGTYWADNHPKNPWISVKDRLPEKLEDEYTSDYVLTRIDGPRHTWYMVNKYDYAIKGWQGCNNDTTHWMPIPPLIIED